MAIVYLVSLSGGAEVPYMETPSWSDEPVKFRESSFVFTDEARANEFARERASIPGLDTERHGSTYLAEDDATGARKTATVLEIPLNPEKDGEGVYSW